MKVSELISLLSMSDPEYLVVLAIDEEGNGYNTLEQITTAVYHKRTKEIGLRELTPELTASGFGPEDALTGKNVVPAIVLWP